MARLQRLALLPWQLHWSWLVLALLLWSATASTVRADLTGSRKVAVLGAREELFGLLRAPLPGSLGVKVDLISSKDVSETGLAAFDTLALLELCNVNPPLSLAQQAAVVDWVRDGGKLLIWDSDRCVPSVNYHFLPYAFSTSNPGARGSHGGKLELIVDTPLGSNDPGSTYAVDMAALSRDTDSGDSNVVTTRSPEWCAVVAATNVNGTVGASEAYAYFGNGLMVYSGFDLDYLGRNTELNRLWQLQLELQWDRTTGIPNPDLPAAPGCANPVVGLGSTSALAKQLASVGGHLMELLLGLLLFLSALLIPVFIGRRNELVRAIREIVRLGAAPVIFPARALETPILIVAWQVRNAFHPKAKGLAYTSTDNHHDLSPWIVWDLVGPIVYLLLFAVLAAAAYLTVGPKMALMLGVDYSLKLPVDLGTMTGVIFVGVGLAYGAVLVDLWRGTPIGRPWHNFSGTHQKTLRTICVVGLVLTIIADLLFNSWAAMLAPRVGFDPWLGSVLPHLVLPLIGALLIGATVLTGWATFVGLGVVAGLTLLLVLVVLCLIWSALVVVARGGEQLRRVLQSLVDLPAWFVKGLWNARFKASETTRQSRLGWLQPIVWVDPEPIDCDLDHHLLKRVWRVIRGVLLDVQKRRATRDEDTARPVQITAISSDQMTEPTEPVAVQPQSENGNRPAVSPGESATSPS